MIQFEPAATLRCWQIDVDIGGRTYTIPALPAAEWLLAILEHGWHDIVPGMLGGDTGDLDDQLLDGVLDPDDLRRAAQQALAAAAGCKWWEARAVAYLATSTGVGGEVLLAGVDPDRVPLAAYLAAAYQAAVRNMGKDDRVKFDTRLQAPPRDALLDERHDPAQAMAAYQAVMARDASQRR